MTHRSVYEVLESRYACANATSGVILDIEPGQFLADLNTVAAALKLDDYAPAGANFLIQRIATAVNQDIMLYTGTPGGVSLGNKSTVEARIASFGAKTVEWAVVRHGILQFGGTAGKDAVGIFNSELGVDNGNRIGLIGLSDRPVITIPQVQTSIGTYASIVVDQGLTFDQIRSHISSGAWVGGFIDAVKKQRLLSQLESLVVAQFSSVIIHEIGHAYGVQHSDIWGDERPIASATYAAMNPVALEVFEGRLSGDYTSAMGGVKIRYGTNHPEFVEDEDESMEPRQEWHVLGDNDSFDLARSLTLPSGSGLQSWPTGIPANGRIVKGARLRGRISSPTDIDSFAVASLGKGRFQIDIVSRDDLRQSDPVKTKLTFARVDGPSMYTVIGTSSVPLPANYPLSGEPFKFDGKDPGLWGELTTDETHYVIKVESNSSEADLQTGEYDLYISWLPSEDVAPPASKPVPILVLPDSNSSNGAISGNLSVQYNVPLGGVAPFAIDIIAREPSGDEWLLQSVNVTDSAKLAAGTQSMSFPVNFLADVWSDVDILARLSSAASGSDVKLSGVFRDAINRHVYVQGTDAVDTVVLSQSASGISVQLNGITSTVSGGVDNVTVRLRGGNEVMSIPNGFGPFVALFGGDGNDVLTGGDKADLLAGGGGNDVLNGLGGNDEYIVGGLNSADADTVNESVTGIDRLNYRVRHVGNVTFNSGPTAFVLSGDASNLSFGTNSYIDIDRTSGFTVRKSGAGVSRVKSIVPAGHNIEFVNELGRTEVETNLSPEIGSGVRTGINIVRGTMSFRANQDLGNVSIGSSGLLELGGTANGGSVLVKIFGDSASELTNSFSQFVWSKAIGGYYADILTDQIHDGGGSGINLEGHVVTNVNINALGLRLGRHAITQEAFIGLTEMILGDVSGDGTTDGQDAGIMFYYWGGTGSTWLNGDFNGDGVVDARDADAAFANWNQNYNPAN